MPVTIKDLAKELGITFESVSAALNGRKGVSEVTRARVVELAKQRGYVPSAIGRSLRQGRTNVFGFYSGLQLDARNWFLSEIIGGLQQGCGDCSKKLLLYPAYGSWSPEDVYAAFRNSQVDGLIVASTEDDQVVPFLQRSNLPLLAVGNPIETVPSVVIDAGAGGELLCRHLAERGHKKVLYYSGSKYSSATCRYKSFCATAEDLGVKVDTCYESPQSEDVHNIVDRYSAYVGWEDMAAFTMLGYCENLGIKVPEELAIVGFNGIVGPFPMKNVLTTIRAPWARSAYDAVTLLSRLVDGEDVPSCSMLPIELQVGSTT